MKAKSANFWTALESQQINKDQVEAKLLSLLGTPSNLTQQNLLTEFLKKVNAYYFQSQVNNNTTFSLYGYVQEIQTRQYKEGKRRGQTYYLLKLAEPQGETLKASQTDLSQEKWTQLAKSALLGQKLVFVYRKWITNKELLDFYPQAKKGKVIAVSKLNKSPSKAETGSDDGGLTDCRALNS